MSEVNIYHKYTNELSEEEINCFVSVYDSVFGNENDSKEKFKIKYLNNIYGPSIHVFAFLDNKCVGIQAFLRNDIDGKLAYQSGDSAVLSECRGKKVFSKMVLFGLDVIPEDAIVYGFPNNNSLPAFEKMNWKVTQRKKYKLLSGKDADSIPEISKEYFEWIISGNKNINLIKKYNKYLLIRKRNKYVYMVYGCVSADVYSRYKNLSCKNILRVLMIYSNDGKYGNGMVPIFAPESKTVDLPDYKIDTLLVR